MSQPSRENSGPKDQIFQNALIKSVLLPKFQLILTSDCWVMPHFVISIQGAWD